MSGMGCSGRAFVQGGLRAGEGTNEDPLEGLGGGGFGACIGMILLRKISLLFKYLATWASGSVGVL